MQNHVYEHCRKLFREAKSLPPSEWPSFIQHRCQGNPELQARLAGLLNAHRNPDPLSPLNFDQDTPRRIGNWELIGEIGKGGAGTVYRARRFGAPEGGIVALKLVRADRITADAVTRFANERELLGRLRHDNIARILDAGETLNRLPFFVMEFVDGINIAEYCRSLRLTIRQRTSLFRQVCVAIHFLHDYGILHRDITPNNLLVTRDGFVKVVDFGISKAFDAARTTEVPGVFERMMTPAYASPEQLEQKKLSRQSDVYSMGAVLYELLTGALPDDPVAPGGNGRVTIRHGHSTVKASDRASSRAAAAVGIPETPEQSRKLLRGSLDSILSMALQREPQHRYTTAEMLRIDLARHLQGLDTLAGRRTIPFLKLLRQ